LKLFLSLMVGTATFGKALHPANTRVVRITKLRG
jgi:hypothetical protein